MTDVAVITGASGALGGEVAKCLHVAARSDMMSAGDDPMRFSSSTAKNFTPLAGASLTCALVSPNAKK